GETNAIVLAAGAGNHGIDADHLAADIEQRAAAVAGVDGGIGLQEVLEGSRVARDIAFFRADDAGRHSFVESERRTDRHRPIANLDRVRVADGRRRQVGFVDLDDRQVSEDISANHVRLVFGFLAGEFNSNPSGLFDHVVICQDVAVLVDHYARPQARLLLRTLRQHRTARTAEEALEEVLHAVFIVAVALLVRTRGPAALRVAAGRGYRLLHVFG